MNTTRQSDEKDEGAAARAAGSLRALAARVRRHRTALLVAALVAACACYALPGVLAQSAALAVVGVLAAGLARAGALARPGRNGRTAPDVRASGADEGRRRAPGAAATSGWVLLVGAVGGCATLAAHGASGASVLAGAAAAFDPPLLCAVVATCLFTGLFEEGVLRVAAVEAALDAFGREGRGPLAAAAASAVLFGLLHLSLSDASAAATLGAVAWAQLLVKPVQAALFGFCLAGVYLQTRSLWPVAGVHALFDALYLGPAMLTGGSLQVAYVTGAPSDLAVLAAATLLLVPAVVVEARRLARLRR